MAELLTIGEPLVVFTSTDVDAGLDGSVHFDKSLGGAELNVMIGASRLGHSTEYVTQVGNDAFGQFVVDEIAAHKVGNDFVYRSADFPTGVYFKELVSEGDPQVTYYRKGSAAANMSKDQIDGLDLSDVKIGHLTGIFPALSADSLEIFEYLIEKLHAANVQVTFDPNLRPSLWASTEVMVETLNRLAAKADVVLPGDGEGMTLCGSKDPETIADFYLNQSDRTHTVIVKTGAAGAFIKVKSGQTYTVPGFIIDQVVDTVGAGDGFALGTVTGLLEGLAIDKAVERGCAVGARQVTFAGDNAGYPTRDELEAFMASHARRN
jgi:2-dehydro-3-deoxygluconokinase